MTEPMRIQSYEREAGGRGASVRFSIIIDGGESPRTLVLSDQPVRWVSDEMPLEVPLTPVECMEFVTATATLVAENPYASNPLVPWLLHILLKASAKE